MKVKNHRKFKLVYNFDLELEKYLEDIDDCKKEDAKKSFLPRYAWFQEGEIYDENETFNNESLSPIELLNMYPDDWVEIKNIK